VAERVSAFSTLVDPQSPPKMAVYKSANVLKYIEFCLFERPLTPYNPP
jgi:hypothetical protein